MEVEVKQPEGYYLNAFVNDITDDGLDVAYENSWRKPETVKFEQCRAVIAAVIADNGQKSNLKTGDVVDAYLSVGKNDNKEEVKGWNRMKIKDIKNDFAVLQSIDDAPTSISDVIPVNQCRHPALATPISASSIKSCSIPLSADLLGYFSRNDENYKLLQQSIPSILVKLDQQAKALVIKAFSASTIKKVDILKDVFLTNSRQKMMLIQRQEEQKKMLSLHEPEQNTPFYMEFDVSTAFMGLAIGAQGANITNARALKGITEIKLDEAMREQGFCKFKIYSDNAEAAEQARNMLEFLQKHTLVPQAKVGQVIGKQGKTIQDIVDKSGVVRVQIGDENPEEGMVPFTFIGTREAIAYVELLVDFQLKHIIEMDEIRAEDEEIRRKLYMSRNSPFQHYNGHQQQQYQQNNNNGRAINGGGGGGGPPGRRDDDRRGGYRGGRGPPNRFNQGGGGGGAPRGGGRPFRAGDGGAGGGRGGGGGQQGGGQRRFGGQFRGGLQKQHQPRDDEKAVHSPSEPQESEDDAVESVSFNGGQSSDQSERTNEKQPPPQNSAPPYRRPVQVGGRFGGGRGSHDGTRGPARNRRSKADDE